MSLVDCPACAGPDNAQCATCSGASQVTGEVASAYIAERERHEQLLTFTQAVTEALQSAESLEEAQAILTALQAQQG